MTGVRRAYLKTGLALVLGATRTDRLIQAFVATDIIAAGLFCLGQLIELQAQPLETAS